MNAKVNANLQAIASATVQAATNIEADLSGAATQITAPEAKQLKADIELLVSLSTTLKQVILNTEQAEVSGKHMLRELYWLEAANTVQPLMTRSAVR